MLREGENVIMREIIIPEEIEVTVNIELYCAKCGASLCYQTEATRSGEPCFRVEPCQNCLYAEYDRGYENGYEDAEEAGQ